MATVSLPRYTSLRRGPWWRGVLVLALVALGGVAVFLYSQSRAAPQVAGLVSVTHGTIVATVDGSGTVAAERTLDLPFQTTGNVADVLVKPGDKVDANQVLARLDDRAVQVQVANAQTSLEIARERLDQAQHGNARPEDLAAARAQLAGAQATYQKIAVGPSAAELAAARASITSAQAQLDNLTTGPTESDVAAATAAVRSAQAQLASAQRQLNDAKARPKPADVHAAELAVEQAKDSLWSAQTSRDGTCGNAWTPRYQCDAANATVAAQETALNTAQHNLDQTAQPASADELAADAEAVRSANAGLDSARRKLAQVTAGPTKSELDAARAQVAQAQANLVKLQQSVTQNDLAAAQASVDQAKANLSKLTAPATASDLTIEESNVAQAELALRQAQLTLENATLRAPFAGVVTEVNVIPGSIVSPNVPAVQLLDRSPLHVDLKLSENDVAKVELGQPVALTIDALSDWRASGTVDRIAAAADTTGGVVTYAVRVRFADDDPRVKIGMTTNVSIVTARKDGVLVVPNTALLPKGAGRVVQVVAADGKTVREVDVRTGLTDGTHTEILSGLQEGDRIVAVPQVGSTRPGGVVVGP